jgi:hypothetical protein
VTWIAGRQYRIRGSLKVMLYLALGFSTLTSSVLADEEATAGDGTNLSSFSIAFLEFFDPSGSGLSTPLTLLWNREIYQSISDLRGAQLVRVPRGKVLKIDASGQTRENHDLAESVARSITAQAAIWGVLARLDDGDVTLVASVTVPSPKQSLFPGFTRVGTWRAWPSAPHDRGVPQTPQIAIDRLNFAPMSMTLRKLYGAQAIVHCPLDHGCPPGTILLYEDASAKHGIPLSEEEVVTLDLDNPAKTPTDQFVPVVRKASQQNGWIRANYLDYQPPEVFVPEDETISGRKEPGVLGQRNGRMIGPQFLPVVDSKLIGPTHFQTRWYGVKVSGETTWVKGSDVREVWSASHVNFIAGIYRYALGRFESAYDEFDVFVRRADAKEENVAISLAYQMMAASALARAGQNEEHRQAKAIELLSRAIETTPFDDRPLFLRAYTRYGWRNGSELSAKDRQAVVDDLSSARTILAKSDQESSNATNVDLLTFAVANPRLLASIYRVSLEAPKCDSAIGPVLVHDAKEGDHGSYTSALLKSLAVTTNCFTVLNADAAAGSFGVRYYDLRPTINVRPPGGGVNAGVAFASLALTDSSAPEVVASGSKSFEFNGSVPSLGSPDDETQLAISKAYIKAYTDLIKKVKSTDNSSPPKDK